MAAPEQKEHTALGKKLEKGIEIVANCLIGGAAAFCIMTLCYFFYFYSLTHQRYFTSWLGPLLYYVAPAVFAGLLIATFWLKSAYRINVMVVLCATFVPLYIVDTGLNIFSQGAMSFFEKVLVVGMDRRSKLEVMEDLKKKGTYAVPAITPAMLLYESAHQSRQSPITIDGKEVLPLGGIANTLTVYCNEGGRQYVRYESDEHGFHNPKGLWDSGQVDIVALGDSFTQGFCVPSEKNFVSLIRERYPRTVNLGGSGDGPLLELAKLKEYGQYLQPKIVLLFFFEGNDWEDLQGEVKNRLLMTYLNNNFSQDLRSQQPAIDAALTAYVEKAKSSALWGWHVRASGSLGEISTILLETIKLSHLRQRLGLITGRRAHKPPKDLPAVELFQQIWTEANVAVKVWDGKLYFVYLPAGGRYVDPEAVEDYTNSGQYIGALNARDRLMEVVRNLGIPMIDIHAVFQAQSGDPLSLFSFRDPTRHYTELGNMLVAREVLRVLTLAPHVQGGVAHGSEFCPVTVPAP